LSLEWLIVAHGIQDRLRETPDRRDDASQIILGHGQPILVEEPPPTICLQRLARERVGQALQGIT